MYEAFLLEYRRPFKLNFFTNIDWYQDKHYSWQKKRRIIQSYQLRPQREDKRKKKDQSDEQSIRCFSDCGQTVGAEIGG